MKSSESIEYVGNELDLFKDAINWKRYFSKNISKHIKGKVLEVGAGIGANTKFMVEHSVGVKSWLCLEPDQKLLEQIKFESISDVKIEKLNGTITDISTTDFDTIIYIDVLEHIEDSKKEIESIKSKLSSQGKLIVLVPAYNFLYSEFDREIGHFRRYKKSLLLNDVNNTLKKEQLYYLDSIGFFASLANKLILKKSLPSEENIRFWDKLLVNFSKFFDLIFFYSFGKSLIGIFKNEK